MCSGIWLEACAKPEITLACTWGSDPEALRYGNDGYALVNAVEGAVSAMLTEDAAGRSGQPSGLPADGGLESAPMFDVVGQHPSGRCWQHHRGGRHGNHENLEHFLVGELDPAHLSSLPFDLGGARS